jgi:hypothetical protein
MNPAASTSLTLRPAHSGDAGWLSALSHRVAVHGRLAGGKGFLVYPLSPERYRDRIEDRHSVLIFEDAGGRVGFLCGVLSSHIRRALSEWKQYTALYEMVDKRAAAMGLDSYFFLDQLVIDPDRQDQGYGKRAFALFRDSDRRAIFIDVLEGPEPNPRLTWWLARGFKRIGEVIDHPPPEFNLAALGPAWNTLHWGVYLLEAPA